MIQNMLNFKTKVFMKLKSEYIVVLLSIVILVLSPASWKTKLEEILRKTISQDAYMTILNFLVNAMGAAIISIASLFIKRLETAIVSKSKNRKIKLIDDRPTTIYLDIFFQKVPFFSKFIFKNIYLKIETSDWIELTLENSNQTIRNEVLIPLSDYLEEEVRLGIQIIKSHEVQNVNRKTNLTSKIIRVNNNSRTWIEYPKNTIRNLLLFLTFQYEPLEEEIEAIIGE